MALLTVAILMSPFALVGCLKGRYALSILGLFLLFGIPAILAATRLARADSWWAGLFYDERNVVAAPIITHLGRSKSHPPEA